MQRPNCVEAIAFDTKDGKDGFLQRSGNDESGPAFENRIFPRNEQMLSYFPKFKTTGRYNR